MHMCIDSIWRSASNLWPFMIDHSITYNWEIHRLLVSIIDIKSNFYCMSVLFIEWKSISYRIKAIIIKLNHHFGLYWNNNVISVRGRWIEPNVNFKCVYIMMIWKRWKKSFWLNDLIVIFFDRRKYFLLPTNIILVTIYTNNFLAEREKRIHSSFHLKSTFIFVKMLLMCNLMIKIDNYHK